MCCEEGGQENELQLCARKESGQLEKVLFFKNFHLILFSLSASAAWSPVDIFTFKLPLCCSSSVSSEAPSLEREKPETGENKEEETLKESAATAEELLALSPSPPPAVQEVPPHLRKQHVRKCHDGCFQIIDFFFFPLNTDILSILADPRRVWHWLWELWRLFPVSGICQRHLWLPQRQRGPNTKKQKQRS